MQTITRRSFLMKSTAAVAGAALVAPALRTKAGSPNEKIVIGCMGIRGRGGDLLRGFAGLPDVEVAAICDIDTRLFNEHLSSVEQRQGKRPRTEMDFRRILDDKSIDALVIGTPDHWHAIPTIMACQAGKHVYVEKPCSHNHREGEAMVAAARKYNRVVQVGIQSRSGRHFQEAMEYIGTGALGKVHFARAWESGLQGSLAKQADAAVPDGVDYEMWLGPAPKRPFNVNRFHSHWHWLFDFGTGDLGNDGVHRVDYARRGLEAAFDAQGIPLSHWPTAVSAGGFNAHDGVQEWPTNMMVTWEYQEYPGALLTYELRTWVNYPLEGEPEGAGIYGEKGYVIIGNQRWRAFGVEGAEITSGHSTNDEHDPAHKRNFLDCIRDGNQPHGDIALGHVSSSLCHLGNIAWRVNRKLHFDAAKQQFIGDDEANRLLGREYRKPWVLPEV